MHQSGLNSPTQKNLKEFVVAAAEENEEPD